VNLLAVEDLCLISLTFLDTGSLFFAGDDGSGEDDDEEKLPSCGDYIMHFITLFWKLLFAFVPPTGEVTLSDIFLNTESTLLARGCTFHGLETNRCMFPLTLRQFFLLFISNQNYITFYDKEICRVLVGWSCMYTC
jgi:hypothetical protein